MPEGTVERMRQRLEALSPLDIEIEDESARHAGHPGAAGGGGHYNLRLTSQQFAGKTKIDRHRLVYDALADLMQREIHALAMVLLAPGETERRAGAPFPDHPPGH
jgi:BolA family transcriptional regulator, general stress-responsive regulator